MGTIKGNGHKDIKAPGPVLPNLLVFLSDIYTEFLNLLPSLFLFRSFATLQLLKCGLLGVPYRICAIDIVDSTHYTVLLSVPGTRF